MIEWLVGAFWSSTGFTQGEALLHGLPRVSTIPPGIDEETP
ncbi:hypothetical protein [Cupriavidus basilensis]